MVKAWSQRTSGLISKPDTGAGIAAEDLPHVFDRFWRAEKSRNRQTDGSGLGLAIARKLVEAHGGALTASSLPRSIHFPGNRRKTKRPKTG